MEGGSSSSGPGAELKFGDGMDNQHWWEYYPISGQKTFEFVTMLEFESGKTISQIVNYNSPPGSDLVNGEKNLCPLWFMERPVYKERVKRFDQMTKLLHGDQLVMEGFHEFITSNGKPDWDWLLKLWAHKRTKKMTEFSEGGDITLLVRTYKGLFCGEEMCKIFPIKQGLLEMLRVKFKGRIDVGSNPSKYWGGVVASFDLLKWGEADNYVTLKCHPPIPFEMLSMIMPDERIKFSIDMVLEWKKNEGITKSIKMETKDFVLSRLLEAEESKDFALVAADGTEVRCHKIVLSMSSPVLQAMLSPAIASKLPQEKMDLSEWTKKAVKSFVDFLYGKEIPVSGMKCDLAMELLRISHQYQVNQLWESIFKLLLNKGVWFSTDDVIELYCFVTKLDGRESLKLKKYLLSVLTETWSSQIFSSERFKELEPREAVELMGAIHDASKMRLKAIQDKM